MVLYRLALSPVWLTLISIVTRISYDIVDLLACVSSFVPFLATMTFFACTGQNIVTTKASIQDNYDLHSCYYWRDLTFRYPSARSRHCRRGGHESNGNRQCQYGFIVSEKVLNRYNNCVTMASLCRPEGSLQGVQPR